MSVFEAFFWVFECKCAFAVVCAVAAGGDGPKRALLEAMVEEEGLHGERPTLEAIPSFISIHLSVSFTATFNSVHSQTGAQLHRAPLVSNVVLRRNADAVHIRCL
jgi:hypothetical protein